MADQYKRKSNEKSDSENELYEEGNIINFINF